MGHKVKACGCHRARFCCLAAVSISILHGQLPAQYAWLCATCLDLQPLLPSVTACSVPSLVLCTECSLIRAELGVFSDWYNREQPLVSDRPLPKLKGRVSCCSVTQLSETGVSAMSSPASPPSWD